MGLKDECGVCGIFRPEYTDDDSTAASMAYFAVFALRPRGAESAGIAVRIGDSIN